MDPDRWEFASEGFLRGQKSLLKNIHRRKPVVQSQPQPSKTQASSVGHCVEVGKFGVEGEIERLKRDKNVLMMELVKLRQQQQSTERELRGMGQRLQSTEQRQQQMMAFLAKAMQSPTFLSQLMQQSEKQQFAKSRKKRRLPKQGENCEDGDPQPPSGGQLVKYEPGFNDSFAAALLQLFNSDPSLSMPVETVFRDLISSSSEQPQDCNPQQGRVTLTEFTDMQGVSGISDGMPDLVVDDVTNQTTIDLDSLPLSNLGEEGSLDPLDHQAGEYLVSLPDALTGGAVNSGLISLDNGSGEVPLNFPIDVFWDEFLDNSKDSRDAHTDTLEGSTLEHEDFTLNHECQSDIHHMDHLVQQLGQLDHGPNS